MSGIPTWHARAMSHPDHQSGMVSEDMLRARMTEEIVDLRAEVERLIRERDEARAEVERQARHIEELREKIDAEGSCACAFDAPGDVCVAHSPALMQARAEVEKLRAENARLRAQIAEYFTEPATHPLEET